MAPLKLKKHQLMPPMYRSKGAELLKMNNNNIFP